MLNRSVYNFGASLYNANAECSHIGLLEDKVVNKINSRILRQAHPVTHLSCALKYNFQSLFRRQFRCSRPEWLWSLPRARSAKMRARDITLLQQIVRCQPFSLNDPRFCYTLDAWKPHLPSCKYVLIYNAPARSGQEMISRLREIYRDAAPRMTIEQAIGVWCSMYRSAIHLLAQDEERTFILRYKDLLSASMRDKLSRFLSADLSTAHLDERKANNTEERAHCHREAEEISEQLERLREKSICRHK